MMYGYEFETAKKRIYTDDELCSMAHLGDRYAEEELVYRYSKLVKACARPYFLAGADGEDLIQEGMFGLIKAIRDFDSSKGVPFEAFARLCVQRRIFSALRAAQSEKHIPLNQSILLNKPLFDDNHDIPLSTSKQSANPEMLIIGMEAQKELLKELFSLLSAFEAKVLQLYLDGSSYEEMSKFLKKPIKSVDNAIQRIRRKSAPLSPRRKQD